MGLILVVFSLETRPEQTILNKRDSPRLRKILYLAVKNMVRPQAVTYQFSFILYESTTLNMIHS